MKRLIKTKISASLLIIVCLFNFSLVNAEAISGTTTEDLAGFDLAPADLLLVKDVVENTIIIAIPDMTEEPEGLTLTALEGIVDEFESLVPLVATSSEDDLISNASSSDELISNASSSDELVIVLGTSSIPVFEDEEIIDIDINIIETQNLASVQDIVNFEIPTSIIRDAVFQGPEIIAGWQMLSGVGEDGYLGADDSLGDGAQILPSGQFEVDQEIVVCAIVAGNTSSNNLVSATINYPENVAYGADDDSRGCGLELLEVDLLVVEKTKADDLICNHLRLNNNNLLTWGNDGEENYSYAYDQVCGSEGFLATEKASLYCATSFLAYDDPAGDYRVEVLAGSNTGELDLMESELKYLELTTYEKDFDDIQYGMVSRNKLKYLLGDLNWRNEGAPTIRNTGNTSLQLKIWQNDFNLGKTNDIWNVAYKARLGDEPLYIDYSPEATTTISTILGLGTVINIDLAILINNFPESEDRASFAGKMTLSAEKALGLKCL